MTATIFGLDYPTVWFMIIAFLFIGYAILDGYDFGAGMWHLIIPKQDRRIALNAVGPLWDGNEVWLLIGGGAMFAGFPLLYASLFSALYTPLMLFLLCIILRAVSIDFRSKEPMAWWTKTWDIAYSISSLLLSLLLGVVLGNVISGIQIGDNFDYTGNGFFEFLHPFALLTGLLSVSVMLWHGALFLIIKTENDLQSLLISKVKIAYILFVALYLVTTIATFAWYPHMIAKFNASAGLWIIPAFIPICIIASLIFFKKAKYVSAFLCSSATIALLIIVAAMGAFPNLLPSTIDAIHTITIYNAAGSEKNMSTMLTIVAIGSPLFLGYTFFALYVFRGKVKIDETSY